MNKSTIGFNDEGDSKKRLKALSNHRRRRQKGRLLSVLQPQSYSKQTEGLGQWKGGTGLNLG